MLVTAVPAAAADISMNACTIRIYHKVPGMSAVVTYVQRTVQQHMMQYIAGGD